MTTVGGLTSCDPRQTPTGALVTSGPAMTQAAPQRGQLRFPVGTAVQSQPALARTLAMSQAVSDAVVITLDTAAYVAIRPSGRSFTIEQKRQAASTIKQFTTHIRRVYVSTDAETFAQYRNYTRYLESGRRFQGMLESWRSVLSSTQTQRIL